jgi:hypothetical protein
MLPNLGSVRSELGHRAERRTVTRTVEPLETRCLLSGASPFVGAWNGWTVWGTIPSTVVTGPVLSPLPATSTGGLPAPPSPVSSTPPAPAKPSSPLSQTSAPAPTSPTPATLSTSPTSAPVTLTGSYFSGIEGVSYLTDAGPVDLTRGGSAAIGSELLNGIAGGPRTFDSNFSLELGQMGSGGQFIGPWLDVSGHLNGSVVGQSISSDLSGGFGGTATSAVVRGAAPGTAIPPALLDLSLHPGRIHVSGAVTGGYLNDLVSQLTIDPPTAATVGSGLASLSLPVVPGLLG